MGGGVKEHVEALVGNEAADVEEGGGSAERVGVEEVGRDAAGNDGDGAGKAGGGERGDGGVAPGEAHADFFEEGRDKTGDTVVAEPSAESADFKPGDGQGGARGGETGGDAGEIGKVCAFDDVEAVAAEIAEDVEGEEERLGEGAAAGGVEEGAVGGDADEGDAVAGQGVGAVPPFLAEDGDGMAAADEFAGKFPVAFFATAVGEGVDAIVDEGDVHGAGGRIERVDGERTATEAIGIIIGNDNNTGGAGGGEEKRGGADLDLSGEGGEDRVRRKPFSPKSKEMDTQ